MKERVHLGYSYLAGRIILKRILDRGNFRE
jgi:hypothetical protein